MYNIEEKELYKIFLDAEEKLFNSENIKFERNNIWRKKYLKSVAGIYGLFEDDVLKYVGETGDLLKRMADITRTVNHSFRKQIGIREFKGIRSTKKFEDEIEILIDSYFNDNLYLKFIEVNFGRLEIETYLVDKYQSQIVNAKKKRKLNYNYELLKEIEDMKKLK